MKPKYILSLIMMMITAGYANPVNPVSPDTLATPNINTNTNINTNININTDVNVNPDDPAIPQRLGILGAEVFLYDVSVGGIIEYRDDWSARASRSAAVSAALALKRMGYEPSVVPDGGINIADGPPRPIVPGIVSDYKRDIFRLKTKMRYHCTAFRSPFYIDRSMLLDIDNAEGRKVYSSTLADTVRYSVGTTDSLCDRYGVDGFVYVYGFEEKFSPARRQFLDEVAGRTGGGKGAKRKRGAARVHGERTFVAAILVGRDGQVLWYKDLAVAAGAGEGIDLSVKEHSRALIGALFE